MNEENMTLDEIIEFHKFMCEAQKIIDEMNDDESSEQYSERFEKYTRRTNDYYDER